MNKNVGNVDRIIRIIIGVAILSLTIVGPKTMWGILGIIPLLTAAFSFCPLYAIFNVKTCQLEHHKH